MSDTSAIEPDRLRENVRSALRGAGLSVLLLVWAAWMTYDFGISPLISAAGLFGAVTLVIFLWQALRPALKLHRAGRSIL